MALLQRIAVVRAEHILTSEFFGVTYPQQISDSLLKPGNS